MVLPAAVNNRPMTSSMIFFINTVNKPRNFRPQRRFDPFHLLVRGGRGRGLDGDAEPNTGRRREKGQRCSVKEFFDRPDLRGKEALCGTHRTERSMPDPPSCPALEQKGDDRLIDHRFHLVRDSREHEEVAAVLVEPHPCRGAPWVGHHDRLRWEQRLLFMRSPPRNVPPFKQRLDLRKELVLFLEGRIEEGADGCAS